MVFDMSLDEDGKKWTSLRVKEANDADASFQVSRLKSVKRANIYLALVWWASWRGEDLKSDEREGNIEFSGLLYTIEGHRNPGGRTLGERLGMLTPKDAERLAVSVNEVVQSSVDDKPVIQPEETTTGN